MGACASKHHVLKGDEGEVPAPIPPPEPTKEPVPGPNEAADVVAQGENKVEAEAVHEVVKANDADEANEVGNDDKVVDQVKENEKEGSAEGDNTPSETMKSASLEAEQQESAEPVNTESLEAVQIKPVEPVTPELLELEKQAPSSDAEKLKENNLTMNQETEEPSTPIEPEVESDAPAKIESAQLIEAKPASEAAAAVASGNEQGTQDKETILKYLFSFI